jgi:ADP-ribose pyrophosphatase
MEKFDDLAERQLDTRAIFDGKILHLRLDHVRLPNGKTAEREYLRHGGAVCVLPLLDDGTVLMERQYRYPMGQVMREIPAGKLDFPDEDPETAARRELREETGALAGELIPLGLFYPACAYSSEAIHMYLARKITFGERELDEDEFLNVERVPLKELARLVLAGEIPDAKTQLAILKVSCLLQKNFI